jgi:hypothetical protein
VVADNLHHFDEEQDQDPGLSDKLGSGSAFKSTFRSFRLKRLKMKPRRDVGAHNGGVERLNMEP